MVLQNRMRGSAAIGGLASSISASKSPMKAKGSVWPVRKGRAALPVRMKRGCRKAELHRSQATAKRRSPPNCGIHDRNLQWPVDVES
jgi:hypothetical protein